jgi:hypothetical protein
MITKELEQTKDWWYGMPKGQSPVYGNKRRWFKCFSLHPPSFTWRDRFLVAWTSKWRVIAKNTKTFYGVKIGPIGLVITKGC